MSQTEHTLRIALLLTCCAFLKPSPMSSRTVKLYPTRGRTSVVRLKPNPPWGQTEVKQPLKSGPEIRRHLPSLVCSLLGAAYKCCELKSSNCTKRMLQRNYHWFLDFINRELCLHMIRALAWVLSPAFATENSLKGLRSTFKGSASKIGSVPVSVD